VKGQDKRRRNIAILEKELAVNPGNGFALVNLGNEYYAMGDNANALEYYEASHAVFDPP
jgi:tetratricopeptide (TPR) repeat protein